MSRFTSLSAMILMFCTGVLANTNSPFPSVKEIHPGDVVNAFYSKGKVMSTEILSSTATKSVKSVKRVSEDAESEKTLKVKFVYNPDSIKRVAKFYVFTLEGLPVVDISSFDEESESETSVPLEAGVYNMITTFNGYNGCDYIILTEKYEFEDDSEIVMDAAVCKNRIQYRSYNQDGERFTSKIYKWDDKVEDYVYVGGENTFGMCGSRYIFIDGVQMLDMSSFIWMGTFIQPDGTISNSEDSADIYINDYGDRSGVYQTRFILTNDGRYEILLAPDGCKSQVVANSPDQFTYFDASYRENNYTSIPDKDGNYYKQFSVTELGRFNNAPFGAARYNLNCQYQDSEGKDLPDIKDRYWFCGKWPEWIKEVPALLPSKNMISIAHDPDKWGRVICDYYDILGAPIYNSERAELYPYIFNPPHDLFNDQPNCEYSPLSVNDSYTYSLTSSPLTYGDCVPVLEILNQNAWLFGGELPLSGMQFKYHGRLGECDDASMVAATCEYTLNGEKTNGLLREMEGVGALNPENKSEGMIKIKSDVIPLSGIDGINETEIHFSAKKGDYPLFPTMRMLQLKDGEGVPSDKFSSSEDVNICFSAGIFNFDADPETFNMWFDLDESKVEVSVECTLHGSDNWKVLEVSEVPENFVMPGWGYYYVASMKNEGEDLSSGWYDLRITLKADKLNYQTQLISPAFRIDNCQGSINMVEEKDGTAVYYDLFGNRIENPSRGIYIRNKGGNTDKIALP